MLVNTLYRKYYKLCAPVHNYFIFEKISGIKILFSTFDEDFTHNLTQILFSNGTMNEEVEDKTFY